MAVLPYASSKAVKVTTREKALRVILDSYRRRVKSEYPKAQFETEFVLGCSVDVFVDHLESFFPPGMNWENHGKWKVSPVRPPGEFNLLDAAQFYAFFRYDNWKPVWKQVRGFVADPDQPSDIDRMFDAGEFPTEVEQHHE